MRPVHLEMSAFGSFPSRVEVDFEALARRGLFVVAGDTGTGKSTIFDAMCFALYGERPHKEGADVRSHHADPAVRTFVRFTFECEGVRYLAERSPRQERPKQRGSGTTVEQAGASVVRIDSGGSTSLAAKATDTVRVCEELVGLKADQFQRVVLLPQGDFARFLLASSTDREVLLGQLFGGHVFDAVVEELKQRKSSLEHALGQLDVKVSQQLDSAWDRIRRLCQQFQPEEVEPGDLVNLDDLDGTQLRERLQRVEPLLAELFRQVADARHRATAARTALVEATEAAQRFDQAVRHQSQLAELAVAEARVQRDEAAAQQSARARPLVAAADAEAGARAALVAADRARSDRRSQLTTLFAELGVVVDVSSAATVTAELASQQKVAEQRSQTLRLHDDATVALDEAGSVLEMRQVRHAEEQQHWEEARVRLTEIAEELPAVTEAAGDLQALRERIERAEAALMNRRQSDELQWRRDRALVVEEELTWCHAELLGRFVATTAARLATELVDHQPCPVCGSPEHPAPASAGDDLALVAMEQVDQAAAERDAATAERAEIDAMLQTARGRLGADADTPLDELAARRAALGEQCARADEANVRRLALDTEHREVDTQVRNLERSLAVLAEQVATAEGGVARCQHALEAASAAAVGIDAAQVQRAVQLLAEIESTGADLSVLFDTATQAEAAVTVTAGRLAEVLDAGPFASVQEGRDVLLEPDDEQARLAAAAHHREQLAHHRSSLQALQAQGVPDHRPDLDDAQVRADRLADEAEVLGARLTTADNARDDAADALDRHDELVAGSGHLRQQRDLVAHVHQVCSSGGALNMPLRRWVLATELDRVTAAANVHLQRMTGARYTLHRRQEVVDGRRAFGLDLEVHDTHTGRARATSSLSGGEQFQASLSLALGLADVVSHGGAASGKRFEALFVDEGFGSLDPTALQDAIDALHQLHATGRVVGAITHVEAMKQDLHVGIEVKRLPDGRGSTLVVHV